MWTVVLGVEAGNPGSSQNNPDENREWLEPGRVAWRWVVGTTGMAHFGCGLDVWCGRRTGIIKDEASAGVRAAGSALHRVATLPQPWRLLGERNQGMVAAQT